MSGLALAIASALIILGGSIALFFRRRNSARMSASEVVAGLRAQMLHLSPADIGVQVSAGEAWGVLMDTTFTEGSASLVSLIDGTASIYFSGGGGVIGGQAHENVAAAAISFVRTASEFTMQLTNPPDEQLPPAGYTRFFVLTDDGMRFAEAREDDLGNGRHELSELFYAGQEVITQLRLISEAAQAAG